MDYTESSRTHQPEFGSVRTASAIFGLSRTELFDLIARNRIRSLLYKKDPLQPRGVRLIDLVSLREYMRSLLPQDK
jgi:hypothetical protein